MTTSVGRIAFNLPARRWRSASYVVFDADGREVDWAKWWGGGDLAGMLVNLAGLPEEEAERCAAWLDAEREGRSQDL
jgi:hypothetical protein